MPSIVCRQPNGKLALYSTIADGFTVWDADEQEMLDVLRTRGVGELERKELVERGLADAASALGAPFTKNVPDGLTRWTGAIESLTIYQNVEVADEVIAATGGAGVIPAGFFDEFRRVLAEERARDEETSA